MQRLRVVHDFHPLGLRDCSLCFNFLERHSISNIEQQPSGGHIEKLLIWLCSLEKKKETENVDHFCVFFNFFRERKSIKVVFRCFRYFFPLWVCF